MKSLSGFSEGKSEKVTHREHPLFLPHTDICLASALPQRRAKPERAKQLGQAILPITLLSHCRVETLWGTKLYEGLKAKVVSAL